VRQPGHTERVATEVARGRRDPEDHLSFAVEDAVADVPARAAVARERPFAERWKSRLASCGRRQSKRARAQGQEGRRQG